MSDELFEVAFFGQIVDAANLEEVKARVGKMFSANDDNLAMLFSGNRVVIKKNIDQAKAVKYKAALYQAGAICEIKSMSAGGVVSPQPARQAEQAPATTSAQKSEPAPTPKEPPKVSFETGDWGEVEPPPSADPLGITGDQIEELEATIAPAGSRIRDHIEEIPEPQFDLSDLDIAPVGSELGSPKKEPDPPPPDSNGISLAD